MPERNEVHLIQHGEGHCDSTDCWCEPNKIYWHTNKHKVTMFVVEHNDTTEVPHDVVLYNREAQRDWITVVLDSLFR